MKVIVIGAGPSGMIAAMKAAQDVNNVLILEKMNMCGKKLLITGKGRCNITSAENMENFNKYIPGNFKFLYSAFQNFTNTDIISLLEENGVKTKVERGNRVFPESDKSIDVRDCLEKVLKKLKVDIKLNTEVTKILTDENNVAYGIQTKNKEIIKADKIILATGGKSYSKTGSTGDGYIMARNLGHNIEKLRGSLVPLVSYNTDICKDLQGLSLKNVKIKITIDNKAIYEDFGEMIFTHFGVSGPIILSSSAILIREKNIDDLLKEKKVKLHIDLKPALNNEMLDLRIRRDFDKIKNKQFQNSLDELLPRKLIPVFIKLSNINPKKEVNSITKEERKNLINLFKDFTIDIKDFRDIEEAIITSGGVCTKEINPKTMESKIIKNLYFAGEIIDVDAYTGGFNLQIAYSTGFTAGKN